MSITDEQLAEWKALAEKATEGPWVWDEDDNMYGQGGPRDADHFWPEAIIQTDSGFYGPDENDRAFIAASRNAVPALIAEIERLRADRAAVVEECARVADEVHRANIHSIGISLGSDARAMTAYKIAERIRALATPQQEKDHG